MRACVKPTEVKHTPSGTGGVAVWGSPFRFFHSLGQGMRCIVPVLVFLFHMSAKLPPRQTLNIKWSFGIISHAVHVNNPGQVL